MSEEQLLGSIVKGKITFGERAIVDPGLLPPVPTGVFQKLMTELDPYRNFEFTFPMKAFTNQMQRAISEIAKDKELPDKMVAGLMLALASALVLRTRAVSYKNGWVEHGNLFMVIVAPSGVGKSHAVSHIFKHIKYLEARQKAKWKTESRQYHVELNEYKKSKDKDAKPPVRPKNIQYLLDDATLEAVAERFEDNPRGFFWEIDELSGWFDELDRYNKNGSGSGKKKLYKMFDVGTLSVSRKSKDGVADDQHYPGACLGLVGGIQTEVLSTLFTAHDKNQGLVNRFIYLPILTDEIPQGDITDECTISNETDEFIKKITENGLSLQMAIKEIPNSEESSYEPYYVQLDDEAKDKFLTFRNVIKSTTSGTALFPFARKLQSVTLRIALLLHYLELLENFKSYEDGIIEGSTMDHAIQVATFFFWGLRNVWQDLGYTDNQDDKSDSDLGKIRLRGAMRDFINDNMEICKKGLTAGEFFDLRLNKDIFHDVQFLRNFLRSEKCSEKQSNGIRFYPLSLLEKKEDYGVLKKPIPKPIPILKRRGMMVEPEMPEPTSVNAKIA